VVFIPQKSYCHAQTSSCPCFGASFNLIDQLPPSVQANPVHPAADPMGPEVVANAAAGVAVVAGLPCSNLDAALGRPRLRSITI